MIPAIGLIVCIIIFHKPRCLIRQRIDDPARERVCACCIILCALLVERLFHFVSSIRAVCFIEVTFCIDTCHIVHGGRHGRLDARVHRRRIDRHAAPAADTDDADAFRVNVFSVRQIVNGSGKIFGIDIRGSHIAYAAAALPSERRIKSHRQKTAFRHFLCVQTGTLLLDSTKRTGDSNGRQFAFCTGRLVEVRCQRDTVAVHKRHLFVFDFVALRKYLIPFLRHLERFCFHHGDYHPFFCSRIRRSS